MLSENFLLDNFCRTGTSVDEFESCIDEIEQHTSFVKCDSDELTLLSYLKKPI